MNCEEKKHLKNGMKKSQKWKDKISEGLKESWKGRKKELNKCPICGKIIRPHAKRCKKHRIFTESHRKKLSEKSTGRKQSKEILDKLSETRKGRKAWNKGIPQPRGKFANNWQGGKTKDQELERKRIEYCLWREAVFERDNWTCQKTGIRGGKLVIHHICNFADYPELRTSIENGITLTEEKHKEFHKIYGSRNNTREQLEKFLRRVII